MDSDSPPLAAAPAAPSGQLPAPWWHTAVLVVVLLAVGLISVNQAENVKKMNELSKTLGFLTPHSHLEFALFVGLALTAGFCEEIIFRGYLQKQFAAASGMAAIGVLAQGILFGA